MKPGPTKGRVKAKHEFRALVEQRGAHLRQLPFSELQRLADEPVEHVTVQGRPGRISLFVFNKPGPRIQVVVQGFLKLRFLPFSDVALDGFYTKPDNTFEPMGEAEFNEFD